MKTIHPRLHVILARESPEAVVIRRGPSKCTAVIGWNRETDHFSIGQWADFDNGRIIWAEYGKILQGNADDNGIRDVKTLFDTNPLTFEAIEAPY